MKHEKIFEIKSTIENTSGKEHEIRWNLYYPRFLKEISNYAILFGWLQNGMYKIASANNGSITMINDRIMDEFTDVVYYLADRFGIR